MRFLTAIIFTLVFIFLAVPIWASETQSVTGVVYETQAGQNQARQSGLADQQTNQQPGQNQQHDQAVQEQSEPAQFQPGNDTQAGQQEPGQPQGNQQTGDQPSQRSGEQQAGQQTDQQTGQNQSDQQQPGQNQQSGQQPDQGGNQTQNEGQSQLVQPGQSGQLTNQQAEQNQPGQQEQTDQQSVAESVYGRQDQQTQSVTETVYSSGNQQQQAQQPVQPRPELPARPAVRAESPPPFMFRGKGTVQAAVYADGPVEMLLAAVEGVPETVNIEVFFAGAKVAEVREGQIVFATPFVVEGNKQVEIRFSGRGKLESAKLHFSDTPLARQSGPEHAIQQPAQPGPGQSQGSDQPNHLSGGQGQAGQSDQGQPGLDKQPDSQSVTEAVYGPA
ncbi:MAG: hypothetical protein K6U04_08640 [Armatimonadetes bacterium]|nr:hypothetical protein [Armatimonadota bacterium]